MNIAFDKLQAGGYRNASEIVREAVRLLEAQEELPSAELEAELIKSLESGPAKPMAKDYWEKLRARAAGKLKRRRAACSRSLSGPKPRQILKDTGSTSPATMFWTLFFAGGFFLCRSIFPGSIQSQ